MKFFNPFKPHIVKQGDVYYVRKFTLMAFFCGLFSWGYLDNLHPRKYGAFGYWPRWYKQQAEFYSLIAARTALNNVSKPKEKEILVG